MIKSGLIYYEYCVVMKWNEKQLSPSKPRTSQFTFRLSVNKIKSTRLSKSNIAHRKICVKLSRKRPVAWRCCNEKDKMQKIKISSIKNFCGFAKRSLIFLRQLGLQKCKSLDIKLSTMPLILRHVWMLVKFVHFVADS